jgi:hypothetical protein
MKTKLTAFFVAATMSLMFLTGGHAHAQSGGEQIAEKEFYLGGLKYETRVKLSIKADGQVSGTVASNEYGLEGETLPFTGKLTDGKIHVIFKGEPPVVGAASDWTDKPWRIEVREGQEVLIIPFYAKNYDTMEWSDTEYEFEAVGKEGASLPPLQENETLCHEDELRRISGMWPQDIDAFFIRVEAKQKGVQTFTIEDATTFECVVGRALVLSNGTSNIRMLNVYDLDTGEELFPIEENFIGEITPDADQSGFTFYRYSEDMPIVRWDADSGKWREESKVPAELFNADLDKTIAQIGDKLFNGMRLAALQKARVDIASKEVIHLNEYKWAYVE